MIGNEPVKSIFGGIFMVENKYYERKIKYLDLMENGERAGGAGFIKTEVRGMDITFAITVKGLHPTDTYEREVMLRAGDGEFSIGRIALKTGQGQFTYHTVMDHSQLQGIRIALSGTREICCKWQEEKRPSAVRGSVAENSAKQEREEIPEIHDQIRAEERRRPEKSKEIQLIPWDEIKAVEESLERVEKVMAKPAEKDMWKTAERTGEGASAGKTAVDRIMRRTGERETAAERIVRKMTAGETTPERTAERTAAGDVVSVRTMERTAAGEMASERTMRRTTAGEMAWERMTAGEAEEGRGTEERTTENSAKTEGRNRRMENTAPGRRTERQTDKPTQRSAYGNSPGREKRPVRLMEDKWQQIWEIYPHIRPFQDEREYLSISPADFVLLPGEAYRAANNSFLLHGYYNYDHLILAKIEKRGEIFYYIGVPGNYYEREKQVAIMFGFESFECGTEPAQAGDFGYYMMRTQL